MGSSREFFWSHSEFSESGYDLDTLNNTASAAFAMSKEQGFDIKGRFDDWDHIYGVKLNNELVGYGAYIEVSTTDGLILYEDLKVVNPLFQGFGIGSSITRYAIDSILARGDTFHVLARTQNILEMKSFSKGISYVTGQVDTIYPIEVCPDAHAKQILSSYLLVHPPKRGRTDIDTFVSYGAYRLGNMTSGFTDSSIDEIDKYLHLHGASKNNGDALFMLAVNLK